MSCVADAGSGGEEGVDRPGWAGEAEVPALAVVAADRAEPFGLLRRLDALGGDGQAQRVRERHHGRQYLRVDRVGDRCAQALDERGVDLQFVYGQRPQVRPVGPAGAEVVDGDPYAEVGEGAQ